MEFLYFSVFRHCCRCQVAGTLRMATSLTAQWLIGRTYRGRTFVPMGDRVNKATELQECRSCLCRIASTISGLADSGLAERLIAGSQTELIVVWTNRWLYSLVYCLPSQKRFVC
jgi:hypothetical protein